MAKKSNWSQDNAIGTISRSDTIQSVVYAPNVYSSPRDTMLYKLYLYILENTEKDSYPWGRNFNSFVSYFDATFIEPDNI